jgi:NADH-quinone oxidoreductase subunit J
MIEQFLAQLPDIIFWLFCIITIAGGLYVLFSNHVLYAAYGLLVSFLGVAGIFVFAQADFVSAAQIMIYVGGILVLLIFGIMLSSNKKLGVNHLEVENAPRWLGIVIVAGLSAVLLTLSGRLVVSGKSGNDFLSLKTLGFSLMTQYVLILEILGILLLMALIGATYLAKDDK